MIAPELLEILVCPETRLPLRPADAGLLDRVNRDIAAGELTTRGGQPVGATLSEALVREDDGVLYPIRDGIPILLVDESIAMEGMA